MREHDVQLPDGRRLHVYEAGPTNPGITVVWHHGTPNVGWPPEPLFPTSDRLRMRWIGYDRPGYGGSPRRTGRDVASAAGDVEAIADALGIERFAVMGHSGGGPHALACAALMPDRVIGAISAAGLAPYDASGFDWFAGMASAGVASLRAALQGREHKERHEASAPGGDPGFIATDLAALEADWSWFGPVVEAAQAGGVGGLVDDDLAYVAPWGFDPADVTTPTLLLHGDGDRMVPAAHATWMAQRMGAAELRMVADSGHISVLRAAPAALEWLAERAP